MARRSEFMGVTVQIINRRVYVAIHRPHEAVRRIPVGRDTPENRRIAERSAEEIRHRLTVAAFRRLTVAAFRDPNSKVTPTLAEFAPRYLEEDTGRLADTTRGDRPGYLRPAGPLLGPLGDKPMDEITPALLRVWWAQEIEATGRSVGTGRHYLDVLSTVMAYAIDLGIVSSNPVPEFRAILKRMLRGKSSRALADPCARKRPIALASEINALVTSAALEGKAEYVLVLLGLDAGLRMGENLGVRRGLIGWAARTLFLDEKSNRPRR